MSAASYTTDLLDVSAAESTTGWAELSGHTSGGAAALEDRAYIQGTSAISQSTGVATGQTAGLQFDYGSNIAWTTGYVFLAWQYWQAPKAINTWANGGMRFGVGSSAGNMRFWNTQGSDYGRLPYGGYMNVAIDPTYTPDQTDGTPVAGNYRIFGSMPNIVSAVSKGNPHCVDAIRYGRGKLMITGGDLANGYGTVAGMAAANDADSARWGLMQYQAGSYLFKGLWSLGTDATAVDFRDANRNIVIDDTPRAYASFNRIEVRHASSRVDWTAFSISALGTLSKGQFEMIANADVNLDSCTFTDMDTFVFQSNATILSTIFRRCALVTAGGAAFSGCTFDKASGTVAIAAASLASLVDCLFISDGTGHAVDLGTVSSSQTMTWDCLATGYASSNGSTGNEVIKVNVSSGQTLTINVAAGKTTPTYYNTGSGTVSVVTGQSTVTIAAQVSLAGAEVRIYDMDGAGGTDYGTELAGTESNPSATYAYTDTQGNVVMIQIMLSGYEEYTQQYTIPSTNATLDVKLKPETNA